MTLRAVVVLPVVALAACAAPVASEPGWAALASPSDDISQSPSADAAQTLGRPFVVLADVVSTPSTDRAGHPVGPSVRGAWVLLSSDACDVFLDGMALELAIDHDAPPSYHATSARARGVVESSSPHAVRVTFPIALRPTAAATPSPKSDTPEAVLTIDACDVDGRVELRVTVNANSLGDAPLAFTMSGAFSDDADAIPPKRWDCPY